MNNNGAGPSSSSPSLSRCHGLPPGYRFKPSDHELMVHLFHKISTGAALMPDIKDVNLYTYHPQTLANMYPPVGDEEWYFFTPTHRKYEKGMRPDRKAGNGFWRAMTADKELRLEDQNGGRKLSLVFHVGEYKRGVRTSWLMHEYRVEDGFHVPTHANDRTLVEWVLCKVYQNTRTVKGNKRHGREENSLQIGRLPAAGGQELNNGDDDEDDLRALTTNRQRREFDHHPRFRDQIMLFNQAAAEFNNGSTATSGSMMTVGQHRHHNQTVFNQAAAESNNGSSMMMVGQHRHYSQTMSFNQAAAQFNNGNSMMTVGQHRHHSQTVMFNQAAAEFNNDNTMMTVKQHHHQNQTIPFNQAEADFNNGKTMITVGQQGHHRPFNQAVAAEFDNGSIASISMMMAGQRHHHTIHTAYSHQTLYDRSINGNYQFAAGGGSQELYNGGEGSSTMAGGDMGTLFNPENYYNQYLDQTSLFNTYATDDQAAAAGSQELFNGGSHCVETGNSSSYHPNFDQSAVPSSNVNVEARGGSEGVENGGGKATSNNQEQCPTPSHDQTLISDDNNGNVEGAEMEGLYINERGHCIMNGERVEMGEYLNPHHHSRLPPSNCNSTGISTLDYFIDAHFKDS